MILVANPRRTDTGKVLSSDGGRSFRACSQLAMP